MTVSDLRRELALLDEQRAKLEGKRDALANTIKDAHAVEPRFFNQGDVNEAKAVKARVEVQLLTVSERTDALRTQLPTPEQLALAEANVNQLAVIAHEAHADAERRMPAFVEAMEAAHVVAGRICLAQQAERAATSQIRDAVRQYGLKGVPLPDPAQPAAYHYHLEMLSAEGC